MIRDGKYVRLSTNPDEERNGSGRPEGTVWHVVRPMQCAYWQACLIILLRGMKPVFKFINTAIWKFRPDSPGLRLRLNIHGMDKSKSL
jgi:hypothetical protein